MQKLGRTRLDDDLTTMCRFVHRSLDECIKYNDRGRIKHYNYPAKLNLQTFDIKACKEFTKLSPLPLNQINQIIEVNNKYVTNTEVSIFLHYNNNVDIKYYL